MKYPAFLRGFAAASVVYLLGQYAWHHVLLAGFYAPRLAAMAGVASVAEQGPASLLPFIIAAQLLGAAATAYFVLRTSNSPKEGAVNGAIVGLLMVGAVNFVNHSLLANWDLALTLVDTGWGILLGAIAGASAYVIAHAKVR